MDLESGNAPNGNGKKFPWYIKYIVTLVIGAFISLTCFGLLDLYNQTDTAIIYRYLSDGFFVAGAVLAGLGLLTVASAGGTFDMLTYGIRLSFVLFKRDISKEKRFARDFYEYRKMRQEKEHHFGYLLAVGLFYIALSVLFVIFYNNVALCQ